MQWSDPVRRPSNLLVTPGSTPTGDSDPAPMGVVVEWQLDTCDHPDAMVPASVV